MLQLKPIDGATQNPIIWVYLIREWDTTPYMLACYSYLINIQSLTDRVIFVGSVIRKYNNISSPSVDEIEVVLVHGYI